MVARYAETTAAKDVRAALSELADLLDHDTGTAKARDVLAGMLHFWHGIDQAANYPRRTEGFELGVRAAEALGRGVTPWL